MRAPGFCAPGMGALLEVKVLCGAWSWQPLAKGNGVRREAESRRKPAANPRAEEDESDQASQRDWLREEPLPDYAREESQQPLLRTDLAAHHTKYRLTLSRFGALRPGLIVSTAAHRKRRPLSRPPLRSGV
jgi:hypothetical protein